MAQRRHNKGAYKSGLEKLVAASLAKVGIKNVYETMKIRYVQPAKERTYTPDFPLPNGIIVETKGHFTIEDRQKHLWIKEQHPALDIRFVFTNPNNKIYKGSKTTYAMWCKQYGFKYAKKKIPQSWIS